jgi:5-formyltetrahydrofolate cyclo-ligase
VQPDLDLEWAAYDGPDALRTARRGLLEPTGPSLGHDAIATADAVLVPGLAVARDGSRLGQGGGCYDRALARVPAGTFVCVLLNSEEVLGSVPRDDHDRAVAAVATELGLTRLLP